MDNFNRLMRVFANLLLLAAICFGVFFLLPKGLVLLLPFVLAVILAAIVSKPVQWLVEKLHFPRKLASVLAILLTVAVVGALLFFFCYALVTQVIRLGSDWPTLYKGLEGTISTISDKINDLYIVMPDSVQSVFSSTLDSIFAAIEKAITGLAAPAVSLVTNFAKGIPGAIIFTVVLILSSIFIISDREKLLGTGREKLPRWLIERARMVRNELKTAFGGYFRAQGMLMTIIFVELLISMRILNNPYGLLIAIFIAIFDALPVFGSGGILIPWAVISLLVSEPKQAIVLFVTYICVLLTRQFLEPRLVGGQIGLHPLLTLLGMFVGLKLLGVLGIILGPITALLLKKLYDVGVFKPVGRIFKRIWEDLRVVCGVQTPVPAGAAAPPAKRGMPDTSSAPAQPETPPADRK